MATRERLFHAIRLAWSADTSRSEQWSSDNAALGQCAVTALVVQDWLGGTLLRALVGDVSHYWNLLPNGEEVDLTRVQFECFAPIQVESRAREYVLSFSETASRYERLAARVRQAMVQESVLAVSD